MPVLGVIRQRLGMQHELATRRGTVVGNDGDLAVMKHARSEDVLLCVTTPFTLPYAVTLAARLKKAASALIIYDLYPDTLVMAGFFAPLRFSPGVFAPPIKRCSSGSTPS
jgi:hypothetical protein